LPHPAHDEGKVTGVEYFDAEGNLQFQKARIVCVAGNTFESPASAAELGLQHVPQRAGQQSDQVGRNYMRHTTGSVYAASSTSR
jgi:hypothetical protein